jgi:hypothetical protein
MPNVNPAKFSLRAPARSWVVRISTELSALLTATLPRRGSEGWRGKSCSRLSGELGEYAVEGERVFESPEEPFTTTDLVPARALNSDVAMVPQNA